MSETRRYTLLHASFEETLSLVERSGGCDLVCTSPPYDDARTYGAAVAWTPATYRRLGDYLFAALKPGGHALIVLDGPVREWREHVGSERSFTPWRVMLDWADRVGFRVPDRLAYAHMGTPGSWLGRFRSDWEPLLWFQRPGAPGYFNKWPLATRVTTSHGGRGRLITTRRCDGTMYRRRMSGPAVDLGLKHRGTLWDYGTVGHGHDDALGESSNHPARFSTKLAEDIVVCFSPPGGLVCDPFLGSGTTAVAALRHGRRFFGGVSTRTKTARLGSRSRAAGSKRAGEHPARALDVFDTLEHGRRRGARPPKTAHSLRHLMRRNPMPREKIGETVAVFTAPHPERADSPTYRRTRAWVMRTSRGCFICGGPVDLSHPGAPGNLRGLEDHHGGGIYLNNALVGFNLFPLEWSMGWGADPKKIAAFVKQLRDAGLTSYAAPIESTADVMAWVDSINNANVGLCRVHHIGHQTEHSPDCNGHEAVGIHNAPWPIVAAQATCDWDRFDMWAGTTGTVAVAPDPETPGATVVHYVHEAHPVKMKIGDKLPATHPHSRTAHQGYGKRAAPRPRGTTRSRARGGSRARSCRAPGTRGRARTRARA